MIAARFVKIIMVASIALFACIVAFDNMTDYGTNFEFVRHVLSMDTTFPGNALMYRSIDNPALWHLGYGMIIAGEGLNGLAFAIAAVELAATCAATPHSSSAVSGLYSWVPASDSWSGSSALW